MNLNKLFRRLSIRAKLAIAFSLIALAPLALVSLLGTSVTVTQLRHAAKETLSHDLDLVQDRTAGAFRQAERHVTFVATSVIGPLILGDAEPSQWALAERVISAFLAPEPALFQIRLVDRDGLIRLVGSAEGSRSWPDGGKDDGGAYYAWRAESLSPGDVMVIPVELRSGSVSDADGAVPAIAFLVPVHDATGRYAGVVVGEAYASVLLGNLDVGSPTLRGTTGLIDAEGLFLYHSARKHDWASLLASRGDVNLQASFEPAVARAILSGTAGTALTSDGRFVEYRPLWSGHERMPPLILYREVPPAPFAAPVRRFLALVATSGVVVVTAVLVLGHLAARQFTLPIYQLRAGARRLMQGRLEAPLVVETNDELEDLARDFTAMAATVSRQREELARLLGERTRSLQATHAELNDILAHSADAIIGLDREDRVRVWNHGAEALFGYAAAEAVGKPVCALIGPNGEGSEAELAFIHEELRTRGSVVNFRASRVTRDGAPIPVTLTQTLIRAGDDTRSLGSSLIIRDHRAQVQVEEQMQRSERLAAMSIMAAGLAHELNNPLGIISGRIECMKRDARTRRAGPAFMRDLDVLQENVMRLVGITSGLVQFARDEKRIGAVDLAAMARRVIGILEPTFVTRGVHVGLTTVDEPLAVTGDEKALETVMVNLLLNAADATPAGRRVDLSVRSAERRNVVEVEVRDTGCGIAGENLRKIFEPFFTTKSARGGTGLGLAVCRNVVEQHRGEIRVESVEGAGSSFTVRLPACAEAA